MSGELLFPRINNVTVSGRLTRDVELRYTETGKKVASFSIAVNRSYQNASGEWVEEVSFVDIVVWNKLAEKCAERCRKGIPVIVEGSLRTRSFTDRDNNNRKVTEVLGMRVHVLEKTAEHTSSYSPSTNQGSSSSNSDFEPQETEDDIPF